MNTTTREAREHIRAFWAGHANAYDDGHGHGVHAMTEQKKWRTLFERHLARACTVLDAGTGTGYCALLLAQMGHKVTALDWSKSMLEAAQKKAAALGLHVDTLLGDIEKTPFADASFDAVTARHVLWTLLQPQDAIQEWSRILKPGGVALVDIALGEPGSPHYDTAVQAALPMRAVENANQIAGMFRKNGFSSVTTETDHHTQRSDHRHLVFIARR